MGERPPALPVAMLAALGAGGALLVVADRLGWPRYEWLRVLGLAGGHGALLVTALARVTPAWPRYGAALVVLLLATGAAGHLSAWGGLAYLAVPVALLGLRRREPGLGALGLCLPRGWLPVAAGVGAGAVLGLHLLLSASLTIRYQVAGASLAAYVAAVAYDVGVNVVSAECFFRGTLFDAYQRRWPVSAALALSTAAALARYLVDPSLPHSMEAVAGAVLYLGALSAASGGLFWWSGSLLPGALAGTAFFLAYRTIGAG